MRLNGPPFPIKPNLLAGTWKQYSKNAKPQENKMIANKPHFAVAGNCFNFKCPYQANVMNTLETTNNKIIFQDFIKKRVGPAGFEPATNGL